MHVHLKLLLNIWNHWKHARSQYGISNKDVKKHLIALKTWFKVVCKNILCTASADSTLNRWWHNISSWRECEGFLGCFGALVGDKSEDKRPEPTSWLRVCNTLNPDCSIATSSSNSLQWSVPSLGAIARRRPPSSRGGYNGRSPNSYTNSVWAILSA